MKAFANHGLQVLAYAFMLDFLCGLYLWNELCLRVHTP